MKKNLLALVVFMTVFFGISKAQYITRYYDPFSNGDKSIGISVGIGNWFGPSNFYLKANDIDNPYYGFQATELNRSLFNPSIMLHYKRVLEGRIIDWGNSFYLTYNTISGKVDGVSTSDPSLTFTSKYKSHSVDLIDLYYIMIPIGDNIHINAGIGLSIGINLLPTSTISYSDNRPTVEHKGGLQFDDMLRGNIDFLAGVDYDLSDNFSLNCTLIGYPFDFFGSVREDNNTIGMLSVGEGLYVMKKFPFQLTLGFTYLL